VAVTRINEFMQKIGVKGGMSFTSGFDVEFDFTGGAAALNAVKSFYTRRDDKDVVTMLCDEAQLPNVQAAVAQITGRYLGEGPMYYPHTRIYTDLSLGFLLDADLTALKFFTSWYDSIFGETGIPTGNSPRANNRINRLEYMDNYTCTARIMKTEPDASAANGRKPVTFLLENCYPYSIDAVPLAYGTSQVTRLTVNLYYTRHTVSYGGKTVGVDPISREVQLGRDDPFAPV